MPDHNAHAVDRWHEPNASHLQMLGSDRRRGNTIKRPPPSRPSAGNADACSVSRTSCCGDGVGEEPVGPDHRSRSDIPAAGPAYHAGRAVVELVRLPQAGERLSTPSSTSSRARNVTTSCSSTDTYR